MEFVNPCDYIKECVDIWNSYVETKDVVFKPIIEERF